MAGAAILIGYGAYKALEWGTGNFGENAANAAKEAAGVQAAGSDEAQKGQTLANAKIAKMLAPYQQAGKNAIKQQEALTGALGPQAQRDAISQIEQSPEFTEQVRQGEEAILANAAATGGLRGGNTQRALAQFRPALLSQLINQRYEQLGGLSGQGLQAAGQGAQSSLAGAQLIGDIIGERTAAQAGGIIGVEKARQEARNQVVGAAKETVGIAGELLL